jgi:hypothetical protein
VYFYESIFHEKSIYIIFHIYKLNNLIVIDDLYSQCLTQTLSKMTSKLYTEEVCVQIFDVIGTNVYNTERLNMT